MSLFGAPINQSMAAGLAQGERVLRREPPKQPEAKKRVSTQEADSAVMSAETLEAVRGLKGNDQEESREDRERAGGTYTPHGQRRDDAGGSLDLNG